jgi:putative DNA primase/helicase
MSAWDNANGRLEPAALWYASQGWKILPCYGIVGGRCTCGQPHAEPKDIGKHPRLGEWNIQASDEEFAVRRWWEFDSESNVGVYCRPSGFFVIDIDPRSGGPDSYEKFEALVEGALPPTVEAVTGEYNVGGRVIRGRHIFYRCDQSESLVGNLKRAGLPGIDIKHNGYVLIAPSRHFSGNIYEWVPGHAPWEMEIAEAPEELLSALRKRARTSSSSLGSADWSEFDGLEFNGERVDLDAMMEEGIDEGSRAVDIYKMTCALANRLGVHNEIGRLAVETTMIRFNAEKVRPPLPLEGQGGLLSHVRRAIEFVAENPKTEKLWPGLQEWANRSQEETSSSRAQPKALTGVMPPNPSMDYGLPGTMGGAVAASVYDGDSSENAFSALNMDVPKDPDALREEDGGEPGKRTLTDTGNGRRLIDTFGSVLRYTPGLGWFHWDNTYWKPDAEDLDVLELAKRLAPVIASEVTQYEDTDDQGNVIKWAQASKSNARLKSAVENANSDPRILVPVDTWDADDALLGVGNGVIDLRTGELLRGRPDLYITRRAPVNYTQGLRNVRWEQFLDSATGGDKELQEWLQRAAGYTLTGLRKYDVMFLAYGPPGSGKNTMVEAIVKCMGTQQYAWPMDSSILAQGDGMSSSTDLYHWAELRGRRMVWVDELPDSERLKENSVKKLTGSSEISARSPGEKPFTFQSRAKLWITTNHRPIINDDAMWRRIRPIPLIYPPEVPDPDLKEYLFDPDGGLPAVLSWAVEGAIKIMGSSSRDALGWCTAVSEAADIYRKAEDRIGIFLDEETREGEGTSVAMKSLYMIYRMWSDERGEKPMTQIAFHRKMAERGLEIQGGGSRAIIMGRTTMPKAVSSDGIGWNDMASRAR